MYKQITLPGKTKRKWESSVFIKRYNFIFRSLNEINSSKKNYESKNDKLSPQIPSGSFKCDICKKIFNNHIAALLSHRREAHFGIVTGQEMKYYYCRICQQQCLTFNALKIHERSHVINKSVLCDVCGKILSNKESFKFHKQTHTGEKPYSCKVCNKNFSKMAHVKEHERIHTGERPYQCEYCGKRFTQRTPLRIHERSHTGERPYPCLICNKGFTSKGGRDNHLKNCSTHI